MKKILSLLIVLVIFLGGVNLSAHAKVNKKDTASVEQAKSSVKQEKKAQKEQIKAQKQQEKAQKQQEKNQKKLEKSQQKALKKQAKTEAKQQKASTEEQTKLSKKEQKKADKEAKKLAKAEKKSKKGEIADTSVAQTASTVNPKKAKQTPNSSNPNYGTDTPIGRELVLLDRSASTKKRSALAMKLNPNLDIREVRASHILVKKRKDAVMIKKDIESGSISFEEAAKKYSICPSSIKGGDLGFFTRNKMEPQFSETAFDTKVGSMSGPVGTKFGWHLIKVTDKR